MNQHMFKSKFDALNSKLKGPGAEDNGITVISTSEKLMIRICVLVLVDLVLFLGHFLGILP